MDFNIIVNFISKLMKQKFTGSITINFINGSLSHKVEKKVFEVIE